MENLVERYIFNSYLNDLNNNSYLSEGMINDLFSKITPDVIQGMISDLKTSSKMEGLKKIGKKLKFLPSMDINKIEAFANNNVDSFKETKTYALNKLKKIQKIPENFKNPIAMSLAVISIVESKNNKKKRIDEEIDRLEVKSGIFSIIFFIIFLALITIKIIAMAEGTFFFITPFVILLLVINWMIQESIQKRIDELEIELVKK